MKPLEITLGATSIVLFAGAVLGLAPELQLGSAPAPAGLKPYSLSERRGRATYVDLGCAYCHSQQPRDKGQAPDEQRGWGRAATPGDYSYDRPHQLGTMRTGPDLLNIGVRQPSEDWHLLHLYQPRAVVPGSIMPSYPFLFVKKDRNLLYPGDRTLKVPPPYDEPGVAVVVTDEARDLVAYLKSLKRNYPTDELPPPVQAPEESRP